MKIRVSCAICGRIVLRYPSEMRGNEHSYCSRDCYHLAMAERNRLNNPTLMTDEVRLKLREAHLNTGKGVAYEKTYGRHTHRIVAEEMLGRPLRPGEVVHRIDGNKRNNSKDNLCVFSSQQEHAKEHRREAGRFF